jgi:Flp pilus assembly protein TadD
MGEVYRARDTRLARDVAIKVLRAHATDSEARERFQREARAIAALQHPNICTLYDVGETGDGQTFLVLELLDGQTLHQRLREGPFDVPLVIDVSIAIADALHVAHQAGIIHRDIKPGNILLTERGPKILDFGLAKISSASDAASASEVETRKLLTEPGEVLGTAAYMSPEQLRGEDVDSRTDLFSLGLVMYEMATGVRAFPRPTSAAVTAAILHEQPAPPRSRRPELPDAIEQILLKALEKDRHLRYQHASDLRADLLRVKRGTDSLPASTPTAASVTSQPTRSRTPLIVGVVALIVALGVGAYFAVRSRPSAPILTDADTIVLGDFVNTTGEVVFDDTLRQGLSIQLQQSPFLRLIPDDRIRRTLTLMGQAPDARLTPDVARQICERTASAAVLDGSISSLGSQYVLGLRATDCRAGSLLDQQQAQVPRKEDVLGALGAMASPLRASLGEALATIKEHETPLQEVTTSSLEALKVYTAGIKANRSGGNAEAIPLQKRAVEIDPDFAIAHANLGLNYSATGENALATASIQKAYELRGRTSDRERFFIEFVYDRDVTGNLESARETLLLWARTYPRDLSAVSLQGGFSTNGTGRYEQVVDAARRALVLDPNHMFAHGGLVAGNMRLERFDEAERALQQAYARGLASPELYIRGGYLAFLRHDDARMNLEFGRAKGSPQEDRVIHARALVLAYSGLVNEARKLSREAIDAAVRRGRHESAAGYQTAIAVWDALYGNLDASKRTAVSALTVARGRDFEYGAAFALALAGDAAQAETLAADLERRFPQDTSVNYTYVPTIRAVLALKRRELARASDLLQVNVPYELAVPGLPFDLFFGSMYPVYVRGEVYLAEGKASAAASEFQKILDHRGIVLADPIAPMARVQLGRALARAGETDKARAAYETFFTLWKDADPDVPILAQARREFARLQ